MQPTHIETTTDRPVCGHDIGDEVIKALGLEGQGLVRVVLDIPHDDLVRITTTRFATGQETLALLSVVENYNLVATNDG